MNARTLRNLLLLAPLLLVAAEAVARVGGGESFGGGGGSRSGGGSYGGGGGGGGGDIQLVLLLIELCIRYPAIGIPVVGMLGAYAVFHNYSSGRSHRSVHRTHRGSVHDGDLVVDTRPAPRRATAGLDQLLRADKAFSVPVFKDLVMLIHRRALEAVGTGAWEPLAPFVDATGRARLQEAHAGVDGIDQVVVGAVRLDRIEKRGPYFVAVVFVDGARRERRGEATARFRVEDRLEFRRRAEARSLPPDQTVRLGCPSCGASIETTRMGACVNCDTPIGAGQLQWQLADVMVANRRAFEPPRVSRSAGGDEPGVHRPTIEAPDLQAQLRRLQGTHPDFDLKAFGERVGGIYLGLQGAWSANDWKQARPWVTDPMYQSLRFWMEQYTENGLRNQLTDVKLDRLRLVRVEVDAWFEIVTVRIWGVMKDSVVDAQGKVVGGNPDVDRRFSEYWTFLRAVGTGGAVHDATTCPSCGAPLDRVGQTGVCGYCDSVITSGRFDWVLSSIEQADAYNGTG